MSRFVLKLKKVDNLLPSEVNEIEPGEHFTLGNTGEIYFKHPVSLAILPVAINNGVLQQQYGLFFSDVLPVTPANSVVSKVFQVGSNNRVITDIYTNATQLQVKMIVFAPALNYVPQITINGNSPTLTEVSLGIWEAVTTINFINNNLLVSATFINGGNTSVSMNVTKVNKPVISEANTYFTGNYPLISPGVFQTELKENDTVSFHIETDVLIDTVEIINDPLSAGKGETISVPSSNLANIIVNIADRGNTASLYGLFFRVRTPTGVWSDIKNSAVFNGSTPIEKVHVVNLNNLKPTIIQNNLTYPISISPAAQQFALKSLESAELMATITNYSTVTYTDLLNQITVPNPNIYETTKLIQAKSNTTNLYNVSDPNLRITAVRLANNSVTESDILIKIANIAPTFSIIKPAGRFRSGGNAGTNVQEYLITVQSNQEMHPNFNFGVVSTVCNFEADDWVRSSNTISTRNLLVSDNDSKENYNLSSPFGYNLACVPVSSISAGSLITLGGFVKRTLTLNSGESEVSMNVFVKDSLKIKATNYSVNDVEGNITYQNTTSDNPNSFTILNPLNTLGVVGNVFKNTDLTNIQRTSTFMEIDIEELS
jgi:hypothetical protein